MNRWLALCVICAVVLSGIQGCVLVVADEEVAHEVRAEKQRSSLARDIERAIDRDELFRHSDIRVTESDGRVTLSGDVESLPALSRAIAIAVERDAVRDLRLRLDLKLDD